MTAKEAKEKTDLVMENYRNNQLNRVKDLIKTNVEFGSYDFNLHEKLSKETKDYLESNEYHIKELAPGLNTYIYWN